MIRGVFVTGTDTEVGKTRASTTLCHAFARAGRRVAGMKPIASGCELTAQGLRSGDALGLVAAMNVTAPYELVNPYAFEPAIAPHIAAREAGVAIDWERLDRAYQHLADLADVVVVEGAGGWLAPIDATRAFADLAQRWQLPVILVVGLRLGCLNHALLTAESIAARGLPLLGWIGNAIDPNFTRADENVATLVERLPAPLLARFPYAREADPAELAATVRLPAEA